MMIQKSTRRLVASGNSETEGRGKIGPHNLHISADCVPHMEKVFSFVRQRYGQNLLRVEHCAFLEVIRLFQSVGCARSKHQYPTVVQTESEIISLEAGLRMDGLPALDLVECGDRSVTFIEEYRITTRNHESKGQQQSSVSHSSTESEIMSLDAGLRMDGLLALDLWDIVVEVLRSTNNTVRPNHNGIEETRARPKSKAKT